jgi:hypothetical protein
MFSERLSSPSYCFFPCECDLVAQRVPWLIGVIGKPITCIAASSIGLLFKKWLMNDPLEAIAQMVGVLAGGGMVLGLVAPSAAIGLFVYRLTHFWLAAGVCGVLAFLLTMAVIGIHSEQKDKSGTPGAMA